MKKILLIVILLFSVNINAGVNSGVGIGPLYGYDTKTETNTLGLDLSYTYFMILAVSIQPRVFLEEDSNDYGIDLQFTVWYPFFNSGGGIGYQTLGDGGLVYHLFFGFPIGVANGLTHQMNELKPFNSIYFEPYYRYNYYNGNGSHEFGVMFKVNTTYICLYECK